MSNDYYTLPIPFEHILERKQVSKCDLQTSIAQRIHLVLVTFFEESRYDPQFGCLVWEYDFENIYNLNAWKGNVSKSIAETLFANEKRLHDIEVMVEILQEEISGEQSGKISSMRKRLDVQVSGRLQKTNVMFRFTEPIYVSPISLD